MAQNPQQPGQPAPVHIAGDASVVQPVHNAGSARDIIGQQNVYGLLPPRPADPGEIAAAMARLAQMPAGDDLPMRPRCSLSPYPCPTRQPAHPPP